MKIAAISTRYKHHAKRGGYITLAEYLPPTYLIGINEVKKKSPIYILKAYKWLYEWILRIKHKNIDLIHIYYGEEYFRFTTFLFSKTPVVATFHQPYSRLKYEIEQGGTGGRIARFTHRLMSNRFRKLAGAIVLEEKQRELLAGVMPIERIHVIYHGIDFGHYQAMKKADIIPSPKQVITVGNWLRDWELYERVLELAETQYPELRFVLINRSITDHWLRRFKNFSNFTYKGQVTDDELVVAMQQSKVHFLPLTEATANNSVMESLAIGCPLVMPDIFSSTYQLRNSATLFFKPHSHEGALKKIMSVIHSDSVSYANMQKEGTETIKAFSWENVAAQTADVYQNAVRFK